MFGFNEREAARKSSMEGNLRRFLFKGISLLSHFNPTGRVFFFPSKVCVFTNGTDNFGINAKLFFLKNLLK